MASDTAIAQKNKTVDKLKAPPKYKVLVCNDDVTPMEFVIALLVSVFKHDEKTAYDLTMKIHTTGSAVAGIYSYEIAEQKSIDATNVSRANSYPLITKVEPE